MQHGKAMNTQLVEAGALTPKQEAFAQAFVEMGDATAAYKSAYETDGMLPTTIKRSAWDVRHNAKVAARIHGLRNAIAQTFVLSEAALKLAAYEIAEADPAALQHVKVYCCGMCHSEEQLAREVSRYLASQGTSTPLAPPDAFTPTDDPFAPVNPRCESCMGAGRIVTYTADTTTLQGAERRLYRGFEIARDGSIKILMHDQLAARDMANKAGGVYVTKTESVNRNYNLNATVEPSKPLTADEAMARFEELQRA
jgi:hypothetical protein